MTPLSDLFRVFGKIGCLSFGGPAAQIALMHRELVQERPWLTEKEFLSGLSFCMLLPGPEAMQLATYAGWRLRGTLGGLIAGLLFVVPGALVILALAGLYVSYGHVPLVQSVFTGIKAAVLVIVIEALVKVAGRAFKRRLHWGIAVFSFLALFVFNLPFPLVIAGAALAGALSFGSASDAPIRLPSHNPLPTIALWGALWWGPVLVLGWLPGQEFLFSIALFFSKLAAVTFGGAYAVLAYMGQEVVHSLGWLQTGQMIDGLGLAETTPGPLILVTEFVGFLAGFNAFGWGMALAATIVTLWVTFVPCFLWIFVGAPYIDWLSAQPRLNAALAGITAAVVGVIANLSVWFAMTVLFGIVTRGPWGWVPDWQSLDVSAAILTFVAAGVLLVFKRSVLLTLAICAACATGLGVLL